MKAPLNIQKKAAIAFILLGVIFCPLVIPMLISGLGGPHAADYFVMLGAYIIYLLSAFVGLRYPVFLNGCVAGIIMFGAGFFNL